MEINSINAINSEINKLNSGNKLHGAGFEKVLGNFIKEVNNEQKESAGLVQEFVNGGDVEIHEVMVAGEKAKTSLQLLMEIRNKTIDMYKELTRMQ